MFAVPFVLAVSLLGLTVTALMRTPETVQLAFVALGLPLFFLSGASWPTVAIPPPIALVASFLPSTAAIDGFVRVTQMGATIFDVRSQFLTLCALVLIYGTTAIYLEWSRRLGLPSASPPVPDAPRSRPLMASSALPTLASARPNYRSDRTTGRVAVLRPQ
jgi:hypothetical protein